MTTPAPSAQSQLVDASGRPTSPWMRFFQGIGSRPGAVQAIAVGASPYSYHANANGTVAIVGGTLGVINFTRAKVQTGISPSSTMIPVSNGDHIAIGYTVAPTMYFIPS